MAAPIPFYMTGEVVRLEIDAAANPETNMFLFKWYGPKSSDNNSNTLQPAERAQTRHYFFQWQQRRLRAEFASQGGKDKVIALLKADPDYQRTLIEKTWPSQARKSNDDLVHFQRRLLRLEHNDLPNSSSNSELLLKYLDPNDIRPTEREVLSEPAAPTPQPSNGGGSKATPGPTNPAQQPAIDNVGKTTSRPITPTPHSLTGDCAWAPGGFPASPEHKPSKSPKHEPAMCPSSTISPPRSPVTPSAPALPQQQLDLRALSERFSPMRPSHNAAIPSASALRAQAHQQLDLRPLSERASGSTRPSHPARFELHEDIEGEPNRPDYYDLTQTFANMNLGGGKKAGKAKKG
ncbi:hypothetical protein AC578_4357 [Pseudocercospora eumusae]|uniref:Uncharacterized protein n=1 Tax=Pseudocercospora eumusae TaxID=321146 RepID=A0A139H5Y6_9PEZI|nr:hypothetical protein AC578_4357 [Pseudocercospora eumusae]